MAENSASRTRSVVGRVTSPRGTIRRRPPAEPAMTLTFARRRRGWKGLRFPASRPVQPGSGRLHLNPGDGVVQRRIGQLGVLGHASLAKFSGLRDEVGIDPGSGKGIFRCAGNQQANAWMRATSDPAPQLV